MGWRGVAEPSPQSDPPAKPTLHLVTDNSPAFAGTRSCRSGSQPDRCRLVDDRGEDPPMPAGWSTGAVGAVAPSPPRMSRGARAARRRRKRAAQQIMKAAHMARAISPPGCPPRSCRRSRPWPARQLHLPGQRAITTLAPIRGDLQLFIGVVDQAPRGRRRARLLARFTPRPGPRRTLLRRLLRPRRIRRRRAGGIRRVRRGPAFQLRDLIGLLRPAGGGRRPRRAPSYAYGEAGDPRVPARRW